MTSSILYLVRASRIYRTSKQAVRTVQTTHFARKVLGCASLGLVFGKCEGNGDSESMKKVSLSHDQCIKQACLLCVNSATTLLTTSSSALLDVCREYRNSLNAILNLMEQFLACEGGNPQLWDCIVEARVNVNKNKASLSELICYMESVEKVVNSTSEAAFLAGAEYMCTALCERLYSAQNEVKCQITDLKKLEEEYLKLQSEIASKKEKENKAKAKEKQQKKCVRRY